MQRRQFVIGAVLGTASLVSRPAYAIGSTLKLVYPYAPGSGGDVLARLLADDMRKTLGDAPVERPSAVYNVSDM